MKKIPTAMLKIIAFVVLASASAPLLAVETELSAEQILSRLSYAMRQQNYQGVVTYEHGGRLETMQTTHLVLEGVEFENYAHLNGPERQHARMGRLASCETLAGRLLSGGLLASGERLSRFQDHYQVYLKGYDRVAGRKVMVLQILPKDNYRYGISLGVDVESGVLLKYLVMEPDKALERIQFVAFELNPQYTEQELAEFTASANTLHACNAGGSLDEVRDSAPLSGAWRATWQPPGFVLVSQRQTERDGMVYTYSDGLVSYSVFINGTLATAPAKGEQPAQGVAQRGATLVVMSLFSAGSDTVHVSLVGEIPELTAGLVLKSITHSVGQEGLPQNSGE